MLKEDKRAVLCDWNQDLRINLFFVFCLFEGESVDFFEEIKFKFCFNNYENNL